MEEHSARVITPSLSPRDRRRSNWASLYTPDFASVVDNLTRFAEKLSLWYVKLFLVVGSLALVILSSILFYSIIYFLLVPQRLHSYPAHLSSSDCLHAKLAEHQWESNSQPLLWERPSVGVEYDIILSMSVPLNTKNVEIGQIQVISNLLSSSDKTIASSRTQALLPQLSVWAQLVHDLTWALPSGLEITHAASIFNLPIFSAIPLNDVSDPVSFVKVCLDPPPLFYSAEIVFHSKLKGVRFLMSAYPITTLAVFAASMGAVFIVVTSVIAAVWFFLRRKLTSQDHQDDADDIEPDSNQGSPRSSFALSPTIRRRPVRPPSQD